MARPLIVFSHGNSFPASTYRKVFEGLRVRGFDVKAVEKFGHDPKYPVSNNWPHLVAQLGDFVQPLARKAPVLLVGHQPWLGQVASLLLTGTEMDWTVKKSNAWWIAQRDRDEGNDIYLKAVLAPEFYCGE